MNLSVDVITEFSVLIHTLTTGKDGRHFLINFELFYVVFGNFFSILGETEAMSMYNVTMLMTP
jgi:hypothetical protein